MSHVLVVLGIRFAATRSEPRRKKGPINAAKLTRVRKVIRLLVWVSISFERYSINLSSSCMKASIGVREAFAFRVKPNNNLLGDPVALAAVIELHIVGGASRHHCSPRLHDVLD